MILTTLTTLWLIAARPQHVSADAIAQTTCITVAVYTEAEGEPYLGKLAVAAVVRERARRSQTTPCAVITARHQFSGLGRRVGRIHLGALLDSLGAAHASAAVHAPVPECAGATHFDNRSRAAWTRKFRVLCSIQNHTFYRDNT